MLPALMLCFATFGAETSGQSEAVSHAEDKLAESLPKVVRDIYRRRYGTGYLTWRIEISLDETSRKPVYEITVFRPASIVVRSEGDRLVHEIEHQQLVIRQDGQIIEEERHAIRESQLPAAVTDTFALKSRQLPTRTARPRWYSEQLRGQQRRFTVSLIFDARRRYTATFSAEGNVVAEQRINF